ncbi:endonuclease domain-containing protein [Brevundimonas lenta]|uniref:Very-short-patch-repair endonuclease n=1 Tax=Brevundimonas lenta TaxID=424796 RepID=A0A7W6JET6_9CAUL|nr:endonuclease domain-containing protein [Brevundimonas lenta]MBB4083812.1 very-short-patch-repair endonuclease [Brevundimonas lenta]
MIGRARRLRADPTHTEAKLWARLRQFDVRFRRQAPIGPYVVDFACHRARLVIEVDGGVHNLPEVAVRDLARDEWFAGQGYRVLRFTTRQVEYEIDTVLDAIRKASPLPLEGEGGGGWGGGTLLPEMSPETPASSSPLIEHPATTPSQPFPLEGKGSSDA